jgi:hypothetical protein
LLSNDVFQEFLGLDAGEEEDSRQRNAEGSLQGSGISRMAASGG